MLFFYPYQKAHLRLSYIHSLYELPGTGFGFPSHFLRRKRTPPSESDFFDAISSPVSTKSHPVGSDRADYVLDLRLLFRIDAVRRLTASYDAQARHCNSGSRYNQAGTGPNLRVGESRASRKQKRAAVSGRPSSHSIPDRDQAIYRGANDMLRNSFLYDASGCSVCRPGS